MTGLDYDYAKITFSFVDDTYLFTDEDRPGDSGARDNTENEAPWIRSDGYGSSRFYTGYEMLTYPLHNIL